MSVENMQKDIDMNECKMIRNDLCVFYYEHKKMGLGKGFRLAIKRIGKFSRTLQITVQ